MNEISYQTTLVYDGVGNNIGLTRFSGDLVSYQYDLLNRVTTVLFSIDSKNVSYVYDPASNRIAVYDQSGLSTYAYDPSNRLVGRTDQGNLVQAYSFDLADQRLTLTDPDGGIRTSTWDLNGRLSVFEDSQSLKTTYVWDNDDRQIQLTSADGIRTQYGYDAANQILTIQTDNGASTLFAKFTLAYDGNGNRTVVQDLNSAWTTYSYDGRNRLIQDNTSGVNAHNYTYSYDGNDNRLTSSETGALAFSTFDAANRLVTTVSGGLTTTYAYSRNGGNTSVLEGGGAIYTMGYDNMLRLNHQIATATYTTYTYDADDFKRYEDTSSGRTTIVWDGSDYLQGRS